MLDEPTADAADGVGVDVEVVGDLLVGVPLVGAEEDLAAVLLLARQGLAAGLFEGLALLLGQPDRERLRTRHGHLLGKRWHDTQIRKYRQDFRVRPLARISHPEKSESSGSPE